MPDKHDNQIKIIKIPCPHCSNLCSPKTEFCSKCGEPLPKWNMNAVGKEKFLETDYGKDKILKSLELLIKKPIPLKIKLDPNSTGYTKENEEIVGLSLFNCGLEVFPNSILKFKALKYLFLRKNKIKTIPSNIGFLSNLEYLDLRINELEELPSSIGLLTKLKYLKISSNKLKTIPDSIGNLTYVKKINLSNNELKILPVSIGNLGSLEELDLRANFFITFPKELEKLGLRTKI